MDQGKKPYIFISYSHKDEMLVHPSIEYLKGSGYRVWYDNAINPGAEWPEVIAEHLDNSTAFLAFISANSLESHNCRREFNFAMMENKPAVTVILEPVMLTPVMKMQLASIQAIYRYQIGLEQEYYQQLGTAGIFLPCKNLVDSGQAGLDSPLRQDASPIALKRVHTGERIVVGHSGFKIGRNRKQCDYALADNIAVSRVHAILDIRDGAVYLADNHSTNHTYLNGEEMQDGEAYRLQKSDRIEIGEEVFIVEEL